MQGFLNFALLMVVLMAFVVALTAPPGWPAKACAAILVLLVGGAALALLPSGAVHNQAKSPAAFSTSSYSTGRADGSELDSKTIVIQNFRRKGENLQLECKGTRTSVTCAPAK